MAQQDRLAVPEHEPDRDRRPGSPATGPAARCGARRARNGACGRAPSRSSARSPASGRGRRSAARNRGWRRARRRPARPAPSRPIIMTSVAVIAVWPRLVRTIGQAQRQHRADFVAPRIFRRASAGFDRRHLSVFRVRAGRWPRIRPSLGSQEPRIAAFSPKSTAMARVAGGFRLAQPPWRRRRSCPRKHRPSLRSRPSPGPRRALPPRLG